MDSVVEYPPVGGNFEQDTINWIRKDDAGGTTYYGSSLILGADPALPIWRIRKEAATGNSVVITYADGDGNYDNIWNNRASLTYK